MKESKNLVYNMYRHYFLNHFNRLDRLIISESLILKDNKIIINR